MNNFVDLTTTVEGKILLSHNTVILLREVWLKAEGDFNYFEWMDEVHELLSGVSELLPKEDNDE